MLKNVPSGCVIKKNNIKEVKSVTLAGIAFLAIFFLFYFLIYLYLMLTWNFFLYFKEPSFAWPSTKLPSNWGLNFAVRPL